MPAELRLANDVAAMVKTWLAEPWLGGFIAVLARLGTALAFIPLPGLRSAPALAKAFLALTLALAAAPAWPGIRLEDLSVWVLAAEAGVGLGAGLLVAWLNDSVSLAMQVVGLQAGYTYASTVDPATQADSAVLQVMAQLAAALLFFQAGADAHLIRAFAVPAGGVGPGYWEPLAALERHHRMLDGYWRVLVGWTASMIELGVRLALPVVGLLMIVDLALALLGRLESHLQLLTLAFPLKMLATMLLLAALSLTMARSYVETTRSLVSPLRAWTGAVLAGEAR